MSHTKCPKCLEELSDDEFISQECFLCNWSAKEEDKDEEEKKDVWELADDKYELKAGK